ncbi:MAG TPA: DUF4416 family protein [Thermotogota bacterium]|nr:DUF4416 family protein [Thermotogota bacterium]HQN21669.1 DUF4416 family protein [Thermotogota bacterium]HQQ65591.1 DUF4416 family protein [Thermotogota bacterium]
MGGIRKPELVNLVIFGFGAFVDYRLETAKPILIEQFGEIDYASELLDFGKYTFYYNKEMGNGPIQGRLFSFKELVHPYELPTIKIKTNEIESALQTNGKRSINLDSGYIHHTQFVLASTKHWANRLYLGRGIYAEITLMYVDGAFTPLPYTYPNYCAPEYIEPLTKIREGYLEKRKSLYGKSGKG